MTITQSLRDDGAVSGSITDAIDKLALAMGGGLTSSSTRQNTDATGRIVGQSLVQTDGERVGVKRSERNVGGGKADGATGETIVYDGHYWTINNSGGAAQLKLQFNSEPDERIKLSIGANGTEAEGADLIFIRNTINGGETVYHISSSDDYNFLGYPGQSYEVIIQCGGGTGNSNGTLIVDYVPFVDGLQEDKTTIGGGIGAVVPEAFLSAIPKLLPQGRISGSGGPAVYSNTLTFRFPDGLRPWWGGVANSYVDAIALSVKYIGAPILSFSYLSFGGSLQLYGHSSPGVSVNVEDCSIYAAVSKGILWPSLVMFVSLDAGAGVAANRPCDIVFNIQTAGVPLLLTAKTLGYFIVKGRDTA